jgi:hypothetical protein
MVVTRMPKHLRGVRYRPQNKSVFSFRQQGNRVNAVEISVYLSQLRCHNVFERVVIGRQRSMAANDDNVKSLPV